MICDYAEMWDTDVCFLHIQLMGTNVRLPEKCSASKYTQDPVTPPRLILNPQGHQQSLSLGINPIDNAEPCHPHDNIVGSHLCNECKKSTELNVCHELLSILVTDRANFVH